VVATSPRSTLPRSGYRRSDLVLWHIFTFEPARDGRSTPKADGGGNGEIDEVEGSIFTVGGPAFAVTHNTRND